MWIVRTPKQAQKDPQRGKGKAEIYEDYRKLLDRKDIDVVTISTPDHWHVRIAIAALKAGKDIYCQKPLTLTIDEGKILSKVLKETNRVFQVGTQQRSEDRNMFLKAVAMVQNGRIGKVKRAICRDRYRRHHRSSLRQDQAACRAKLGDVARPVPGRRLHQRTLPRHVSLVVRIQRRQAHRLGRTSRRHRSMGLGLRQRRARHGRGSFSETARALQEWLPDRGR